MPGPGTATRLNAKFTPGTKLDTNLLWDFQTTGGAGGYLPPGASGEYSWHLEDQAGNKLDTPFTPFRVDYNRKEWKQLKNDRIAIYWDNNDDSFGQQVFDRANQTVGSIQILLGTQMNRQIQVFIYGDQSDFKSALQPSSQNSEWVGGETYGEYATTIIWADANNLHEALRATTHEMTHMIVHDGLGNGIGLSAMPHWMDEGLAVYHESFPPALEPFLDNPLKQAIQSDTLLRLRGLGANFPADSLSADKAYAESFSVVSFIITKFGADKLRQLFNLFKGGTTADAAFQQVLSVDTDGLENLWRQSVGLQAKNYPQEATPTPGGVPTFAFSSVETPSGARATPTTVALQQPTAAAPTAIAAQPPAQGPTGGAGPGGICGGMLGVMGLAAFGVWRIGRRKG
jgi:hypothetical protein